MRNRTKVELKNNSVTRLTNSFDKILRNTQK